MIMETRACVCAFVHSLNKRSWKSGGYKGEVEQGSDFPLSLSLLILIVGIGLFSLA